MFGKFGGIVIIALSITIIAGLVLRTTPEHPPALNLGVTDNKAPLEVKPTAPTEEAKPTTDITVETDGKKDNVTDELEKETVSAELNETKGAMVNKEEETESTTIETIKDTVTDTVEGTDEVIGVIKEIVETKSE